MQNADGRVTQLATSVDATVGDAQTLVRNADRQIAPLVTRVKETAEAASAALEQAAATLAAAEKTVGDDSRLQYDLSQALREVASAARSVRVLSEFLEQHPDALLRGKGRPGGR